jgi:hypothetical protein
MNKLKIRITGTAIAGFIALIMLTGSAPAQEIVTYNIAGKDTKVNISKSLKPTTLEDRIEKESGFYFFRLAYKGNFFSINLPQRIFVELPENRKQELLASVLGLYSSTFDGSRDILGFVPEGYKFNVTFARTREGDPFNRVYDRSKTSNIYTGFMPYEYREQVMTAKQEWIMLHEIGHAIFAIAVGNIEDPRNKYMEEGVVDYLADEVMEESHTGRKIRGKFAAPEKKIANMRGLAQIDVDTSIWGEDFVMNVPKAEGYAGVTHHLFGLEFIEAFIDVFGKKDLLEFLRRFKRAEDEPGAAGRGTETIRGILLKMGYTPEQITAFEEELHAKLRENVFVAVRNPEK